VPASFLPAGLRDDSDEVRTSEVRIKVRQDVVVHGAECQWSCSRIGPSGPMVSGCSSTSTRMPVFAVLGGGCGLLAELWAWCPRPGGRVVEASCRGDERVFATATDRWLPFVVDLGHREEAAVEEVSEPHQ
jgi:hypothetical protein